MAQSKQIRTAFVGGGKPHQNTIHRIGLSAMMPPPFSFMPSTQNKSTGASVKSSTYLKPRRKQSFFTKCWQRLGPILRPATCISIKSQGATRLIENGNTTLYIPERSNNSLYSRNTL